jgi:hypothetical protein
MVSSAHSLGNGLKVPISTIGGTMARKTGIWIDHRQAFLVHVEGEEVTTVRLEAEATGRSRAGGGSRSRTPYGPQDVASEAKMDEKYGHQLRRFYDRVIDSIQDTGHIYIFGPGEAKIEFRKRIEESKELAKRLAAVETADKMTENQIVAKVKQFFAPRV